MKRNTSTILTATCVLGATFSLPTAMAADYLPPQEYKVMFELDKIPLDRDMVNTLSWSLSNLVRPNLDQRRKTHDLNAQILSLSLRLNPENDDAKAHQKAFIAKRPVKAANEEDVQKSTKIVQRMINHLAADSSNRQSGKLMNFLKDVLVQVDPNNPRVRGHKVNAARWDGIITKRGSLPKPPITPPVTPPVDPGIDDTPDKPDQPDTADTGDKGEPDKPDSGDTQPVEKKATWSSIPESIKANLVLMIKVDDKDSPHRNVHDVNVSFDISEKVESKLHFNFEPRPDGDINKKVKESLNKRLVDKYGSFPNLSSVLEVAQMLTEECLGQSMAALMLDLSASLEGIEMRKDIAIAGDLWTANELGRSSNFWRELIAFRTGLSDTRLLCPLSTREDFKHLVILEEPEFFAKNEVIAVKNIDDALRYAAKETSDEKLQQASAIFKDIQKRIGTRSVGSFSVDKRIRAKLEQILELNPNHISAEMILLRGDNSRSTKLSSKHLSYELNHLVGSFKWVSEKKAHELNAEHMKDFSDDVKDKMKKLKRYISSKDADIQKSMDAIASELNNIGRAREKDSSYHKRAAANAHRRLKDEYQKLRKTLDMHIGKK